MNFTLHASFTKRFPGGPEIRVNEFQLADGGGVTVLFGPSGSGKTTVLRCLAGLDRPDEGTIQLQDEVWFDAGHRVFVAPRHRGVGYVPQDYALFPHLTVGKNIDYGLHGLARPERQARVREALHWLGLEGLEARLPAELSGGQKQRVAVARAVVRRPGLLLLDEPLSALDTPTRHRLRGELRALLKALRLPTVLVTHDRLEAAVLGDQLMVLDHGQVLQSGAVEEVFRRPASLGAATILGADTVVACEVLSQQEGLVTLAVGRARLMALAESLPAGARHVHVCIHAEDVILARSADMEASPRNRLPARVSALNREGPLVRIELDCGFPLKALLTPQACAELALHEGGQVLAMIKAPQIHLIAHTD